jgi:co-chaperonin GroES (HSP10)
MNLDEAADQVRDGMTANVVITTEKKSDVISVPQGSITSASGKQTVKVQVGKDVVVKEVTVGDISSNGQAEIVSGLNTGDMVVIK